MCLFPMGDGAPQLLISPSQRALQLANSLKPVLVAQAVTALVLIISGNFIWNLINIVVIGLGFWAIRNNDGYDVQKIPCYTIFSGINAYLNLADVILAGIRAKPYDTTSSGMRMAILVVEPINIIVSVVGVYLSNALYNELRNIINRDGLGAVMGGPGMGPGPAASMPSFPPPSYPPPGDSSYRPNRPNGAAPPGFKPFSGQGYRLDGKK